MKYSLKKPRIKKSIKRKSPKTTKKLITSVCNQIISRKAENKAWFDYGNNVTIISTALATPVFRNLVPTLAQGTGHSARIGNEVRVKNAFIRGHVNILPYNAVTNPFPLPIWCKMWLISYRLANGNALNLTSIGSNFFDVVNTSVGMQGNMLDMNFTCNKDVWICHAQKTIKLGGGYVSSVGPTSTGSYYDNSPMSAPFYFNYTKHINLLKYDDSASATAVNKNIFLIFQVVNADGSASSGYTPAEFTYSTRVEYEDF